MKQNFNERSRKLNDKEYHGGEIIYWMSRDQRIQNNWALIFTQNLAEEFKTSFRIIFNLKKDFLNANKSHYEFMRKGLRLVREASEALNISFSIITGDPAKSIPAIITKIDAGGLVTDFSPLRQNRKDKNAIADRLDIPFWEVDAHNIIPCWLASDKKEYAAWTFRKKVNKKLNKFLINFPRLTKQDKQLDSKKKQKGHRSFQKYIDPVDIKLSKYSFRPGKKAADDVLTDFIKNKLSHYAQERNDPNKNVQSNLSPYLHFGHISAQQIALKISNLENINEDAKDEFLEELIVRKELSDNFCFYEKDYDGVAGFPDWARKTLKDHQKDKRQYTYTLKQLENAQTHDELWNACQIEMTKTGKMHGYMRMYWAKKILEWQENAETALNTANLLNNKYELDGRNPNGYTGTAWAIGGVHDRPWPERKIFGKIRYMNANGAKRKFNTKEYIQKVKEL
jgi:deoxyribodipyrimidine photo-lyase